MTPKQAAFIQQYLVDKNATQAAIRAGYSAKTASSAGERLLRNVEVCEAIERGMSDLAGRLGITAERVLLERSRLAFFDVRKLFRDDGGPKPINELDDDTAAAIAGLEVAEIWEGSGEDRHFVGYLKKYKLASKDPSLAALDKYFGLNEKAIRFLLPSIEVPADCAKAQASIIQAVAAGSILPSEAETLAGLVEQQRRSLETSDMAERLATVEALLKERGRA
ncbi:hypothetical protein AT959_14925 [Dechloromonas denitrificans]|uniref:Terminase n=1 Tax=Dechloromonas denitrificans TaxID=281362 RepID=A0A133XEB5_9RHOO|nr:terminase small subunit [Dechloromonas denitrificans]KXB29266.1 hypothetical protein AT959_14925 [Dechloromonas denitrificans]